VLVHEFVSRYGNKIRRNRGGWILQCVYPEHSDRTPSLSINHEGLFYCWGCRRKGNFARLLHDIAGWSWPAAIKHADLVNRYEQSERANSLIFSAAHTEPTYSRGLLGLYAVDWEQGYQRYQQAFEEDDPHFPPWAFPFRNGFMPETLIHFHAGYDTDLQRVTIPIFAEGKLVGLTGRTCINDDIKYYVYPGTQPSKHVYNLHPEPVEVPQPFLIVCEGPWDVWRIWQETRRWAVALMTTHLSHEQWQALLRSHSSFVIMFDADTGGRQGAAQVASNLLAGGATIDISMPTDDLKSLNRQQMETVLRQRQPFPAPSAMAMLEGETSHDWKQTQLGGHQESD
jgi:DNA primase